MKVKEIMTKEVISFREKETIEKTLEIMNKNKINGAPVVDEEDNLVGFLVKADIYRFLIDPGHYESCPVEWVMTREVITGELEEDIIEIAKRLRDNDIIAMPIIKDKKVIGVISLEDIIDYYIISNETSK